MGRLSAGWAMRSQSSAHRRDHQGPVDQDRMGLEGVEQFVVAQREVAKAQFVERCALFPQRVTHRKPGPPKELVQQAPRRRGLA